MITIIPGIEQYLDVKPRSREVDQIGNVSNMIALKAKLDQLRVWVMSGGLRSSTTG